MHRKSLAIFSEIALISSVFASPWDILREPVNLVGTFSPILSWVLLIVAGVLMVISILAHRKRKSHSTLWVGVAFNLFFLKSLLVVLDIYVSSGNFFNYAIQSLFDLAILASLFIAIFKKE
jgi:hypothetical protein